jgi:hypothetical protein
VKAFKSKKNCFGFDFSALHANPNFNDESKNYILLSDDENFMLSLACKAYTSI